MAFLCLALCSPSEGIGGDINADVDSLLSVDALFSDGWIDRELAVGERHEPTLDPSESSVAEPGDLRSF